MNEFIQIVEGVLKSVIKSIVDQPESVEVVHSVGDQLVVFSVKCDKGDRGKVIGKEGRMAISLRNIVNALSAKHKTKGLLEIDK